MAREQASRECYRLESAVSDGSFLVRIKVAILKRGEKRNIGHQSFELEFPCISEDEALNRYRAFLATGQVQWGFEPGKVPAP